MRAYLGKRLMLSSRVLVIVLALSVPLSAAEKFPVRPITIVVPFASGGLANIIMHTLAPIVEKDLGVPIVVIEKPGSGGAVGWRWLQSEKPADRLISCAKGTRLSFLRTLRRRTILRATGDAKVPTMRLSATSPADRQISRKSRALA